MAYRSDTEEDLSIIIVLSLLAIILVLIFAPHSQPPSVSWANYEQKVVKVEDTLYMLVPIEKTDTDKK